MASGSAAVDTERKYQDAVIITDIKEIKALPWLQEILLESRGHRRYGSAALRLLKWQLRVPEPSSTSGSPLGHCSGPH